MSTEAAESETMLLIPPSRSPSVRSSGSPNSSISLSYLIVRSPTSIHSEDTSDWRRCAVCSKGTIAISGFLICICLLFGWMWNNVLQSHSTQHTVHSTQTEESEQGIDTIPTSEEALIEDKTSVVVMGYSPHRIPNYKTIFESFGKMSSVLDQIVFIWNNQDVSPPNVPSNTAVPITKWMPSGNRLSNRFDVSRFLRTESMVTVDDDIMVTEAVFERMLAVHNQNISLIAGTEGRSYAANGTYAYRVVLGRPKMALTGLAIYSVHYATELMQQTDVVHHIDEGMNCEDIAMNFLVRSHTNADAVVISLDKNRDERRWGLGEKGKLSGTKTSDGRDWTRQRSDCVRFMERYFNTQTVQLDKVDADAQ